MVKLFLDILFGILWGTVVDKNKTKHKITVLTPSGPVEVKIWKNQFAFYDQTLLDPNTVEKEILQPSFL